MVKNKIFFTDFTPEPIPNTLISLNIFRGLELLCRRLSSLESSKDPSEFSLFFSRVSISDIFLQRYKKIFFIKNIVVLLQKIFH